MTSKPNFIHESMEEEENQKPTTDRNKPKIKKPIHEFLLLPDHFFFADQNNKPRKIKLLTKPDHQKRVKQ